MKYAVFTAFALFGSLASSTTTGQPIYSDPPCPDIEGWNCAFSLYEPSPSPVTAQPFVCPDCIQELQHHSQECVSTPGQGNVEQCGWPGFTSIPNSYQRFECNPGNSAAGTSFCDPSKPVGDPWDSAFSTTVVRYTGTRYCPPGDCLPDSQ